jgi:hypothetical protein
MYFIYLFINYLSLNDQKYENIISIIVTLDCLTMYYQKKKYF